MLAWIWSNFPSSRLSVKFVPGKYNEEADVLSRWRRVEGSAEKEGDVPSLEIKHRGVELELPVNVSETIDDYT